ncbi:hypothetical protein F7734_28610 [Scytonema sp. UIC 10036]|uniref:hypothetical protein n=1 Tax=Scytonema sp. UIC 10036 TaxID=2304196 RepID=UPI0012DA548C|nr:hypothetical protein [Scytonema sp. UIC 10036]MUG96090.1 hypothetical protein [Scytonema sp. UIC 10036]
MSMRKIFDLLSITLLVASPVALGVVYAQTNTSSVVAQPTEATTQKNFPLNEPQVINFEPHEGFEKLTERQKLDQLRDWLLLTVITGKGLEIEKISQGIYDLPTVRYGYMSAISNFEYGTTRSLNIGDGKIVALVPKATSNAERIDDLAHIADRHRKDRGKQPKLFEVFEYEISEDKQTVVLTKRESVGGEKLFSSDYGYHQASIQNFNDFQKFITQVDDVTFAEIDGSSLTLGGRKISGEKYQGIRVEDIAAIWQSEKNIQEHPEKFNNVNGSGFSLDPEIDYRELQKILENEKPLLQAFKIGGKPVISDQDIQKAQQGLSQNDIDPYRQLMERLDKFLQTEQGYQSLREGQIGAEIKQAIKPYIAQQNRDIEAERRRYENRYRAEIEALIKSLQEAGYSREQIMRQIEPEIQKREQKLNEIGKNIIKQKDEELASTQKKIIKSKLVKINNLLDSPDTQSFQAARYDGDLKGTEVGMVLFYTDLLAKLWALNYLDSTPKPEIIPDFYPLTKIKISSIYKQELEELPHTRLWFGPQDRGFQEANGGNNLLFARNATRIYAKSSKKSKGVETTAAANTDAFLSWWNDHYEEVARYEPQYQRLNQIMKWSLIINWLNKSYHSDKLGFLQEVSVKRDNWFPDWIKAQGANLKFQQWQAVKFYERGYKGAKTETMPLLASESYQLFGQKRSFRGGVSLADRSTFYKRDILPAKSEIDEIGLRSNLKYNSVVSNEGKLTFQTLDETTYSIKNLSKNVSETTVQAETTAKFRSFNAELANQKFTRRVAQTADGVQINTSVGDTEFGNLKINKTANGFNVGFESRDIDAGSSMSLRLSKYKGNDVLAAIKEMDGVVEVRYSPEQLNNYYVKLAQSNRWIKLREGGGSGQPPVKPPKTKMAVGEPDDGRIFHLDWLDEAQVSQQTQGFQKFSGNKANHQEPFNPRQEAQKLIQNPLEFIAFKKLDLQQRIQNIDVALEKRDYTTAEKFINQSIKFHGKDPNLMLRKAVVEIHQGRLKVERTPPGSAKSINQNFLDEIRNRNFKSIETDTEFIYVQDSPGLNNVNFTPGVAQSVPFGSGARFYKFQPGKIGGVKISQSGFGDASTSSHASTQYQGTNQGNSLRNQFRTNTHLFLNKNECQEKNEKENDETANCLVEKPVYVVTESETT